MTVDALNMVLVAVLVFLLMRQVMPIAAALAGGVSLNSFAVVSRAVHWSVQRGGTAARQGMKLAVKSLTSPREAPGPPATVPAPWRDN